MLCQPRNRIIESSAFIDSGIRNDRCYDFVKFFQNYLDSQSNYPYFAMFWLYVIFAHFPQRCSKIWRKPHFQLRIINFVENLCKILSLSILSTNLPCALRRLQSASHFSPHSTRSLPARADHLSISALFFPLNTPYSLIHIPMSKPPIFSHICFVTID